MKTFAHFDMNGVTFQNAYKTQYERYMSRKPTNGFDAWITLPGTQKTPKEHSALFGDIGLVAETLKVSTDFVYHVTRHNPDCCRDAFEREVYNEDGDFLGTIVLGESQIDHDDYVNFDIISRFREYWQNEIDAYFSDKKGYQVQIKMKWYSKDKQHEQHPETKKETAETR